MVQKIAVELMSNYVIDTGNVKYRLLEIEFYYHIKKHPDEATHSYAKNLENLKIKQPRLYRHKNAQRKNLTWFIHYSGIDIGDGTNPGGVLIRAIQNIDEKKEIIKGPLVVLLELMNQGISIDGSGVFKLSLVRKDVRFGNGEKIERKRKIGINTGDYEKEEYNSFLHPPVKPAPTSK